MLYDRAFPYIDVSYMRMGGIDMNPRPAVHVPGVDGDNFRRELPATFDPMNNGMRYGLVWDLAPRHYNDSVDEPLTRPLARYVSELIDLASSMRICCSSGASTTQWARR